MNLDVETGKSESKKSNRGRKPKGFKKQYELNREQKKFFIDLSGDSKGHALVIKVLEKVNVKDFGEEVSFKDICLYAIDKLVEKDFKHLQDSSLSEMEKVDRARIEYNKKNKTNLELGEFLLKKLNIS